MEKGEFLITETCEAAIAFAGFQEAWKAGKETYLQSIPLGIGGASFIVELSESEGGAAEFSIGRTDTNVLPVHATYSITCMRMLLSVDKPVCFFPQWARLESRSGCCRHGRFRYLDTLLAPAQLLQHAALSGDVVRLTVRITTMRPCSYAAHDFESCLKVSGAAFRSICAAPDLTTLAASNGHRIEVPKQLLCARSPVLRAALESNMVECTSGILSMPDVSQEALQDLSECLYTGGLPPSIVTDWERLAKLLVVADKYAIAPLAHACTFYLSIATSNDNAAKLLSYVERYGLTGLRKVLMNFARSDPARFEAIRQSEEYAALSADVLRELMAMHFQGELAWPNLANGVPYLLQWGDAPLEFGNTSDWEALPADALRRACLERELATTGTKAELVARLSKLGAKGEAGSEAEAGKSREVCRQP